MMPIAFLLHKLKLLTHKSGDWSLFSADIDDHALNTIFEKFLFHFYQQDQTCYRVESDRMEWDLEGNKTLPSMLTDVSLTHRKSIKICFK